MANQLTTQILSLLSPFQTPAFSLEISKFQDSEYEVHHSSPTDEG
jgi:hypothetical protein